MILSKHSLTELILQMTFLQCVEFYCRFYDLPLVAISRVPTGVKCTTHDGIGRARESVGISQIHISRARPLPRSVEFCPPGGQLMTEFNQVLSTVLKIP